MSEKTINKSYGGFLELEIGLGNNCYHKNAIPLSHGRACIAYILDREKPQVVHVPFYACGAILEPIDEREIEISFYNIDHFLDPIGLPDEIGDDELIIYINYFGLKSETMEQLVRQFGRKLVSDNCMSFFSRQYGNSYTYNSCRKFFGVPDGSYLYTPEQIGTQFNCYKEYGYDHLIARLSGDMDNCYEQFLNNEEAFDCNIYGMSMLTKRLMSSIDYNAVAEYRRRNFLFVHEHLGQHNRLQLSLASQAVPHYYPLLVKSAPERALMAKDTLFIPTLWPDMMTRKASGFDHEIDLAKNILPLPIDQRYTTNDMEQMIKLLKRHWMPASV